MSAVLHPRGQLKLHVALSRLNTWRVGGPADCLFRPADLADLGDFLSALPAAEPLLWLGFGSNLLVRDGGVRGTVITLREALTGIAIDSGEWVRAEAGAPCAKVARQCAAAGLAGLEFFAGIPGSVGGALAMNAGAFGQQTWDVVQSVETIDRKGRVHQRGRECYRIGYRSVVRPAEEWFVAANFRLQRDERARVTARIKAWVNERNTHQPLGTASCGSVFRNPPGDHAGRLIEQAGLKGAAVGGARVSTLHGNFIVNEERARAADVEALIRQVQAEVHARFGVHLETEVCIVGEDVA